jgi:hypothetical protein
MNFTPGLLISLLTFPGVVLRAAAQQFFCRGFRVAVLEVRYFGAGNPAGYVWHEPIDDFPALWFVSLGPFLISTALCIFFCSVGFLPLWELKVADPAGYFFYWLGLSFGMHAFPSGDDLSRLWSLTPREAKQYNLLAILSLPLIAILYALNRALAFWAELAYGMAVGLLAPLAIFRP